MPVAVEVRELKEEFGQFVLFIVPLVMVCDQDPVCSKVLAKTEGDMTTGPATDCCEKKITEPQRQIMISINFFTINPPRTNGYVNKSDTFNG
jgi:hypothetical protein